MSVQPVQQNVKPTRAAVPQTSTERQHGAFSQISTLPLSFSIKPNEAAHLYRARMDNRDVVLRVLKGKVRLPRPHTEPRRKRGFDSVWNNRCSHDTSDVLFVPHQMTKHVVLPDLLQKQQPGVRGSTSWVLPPLSPDWGHTPSYLRCWV